MSALLRRLGLPTRLPFCLICPANPSRIASEAGGLPCNHYFATVVPSGYVHGIIRPAGSSVAMLELARLTSPLSVRPDPLHIPLLRREGCE
jgi:hypothetical protein